MRRKIKLLSSIACLGLTLAIMTIGVYAAATHSLSVNNSISFNIGTNVAFTFTGSLYNPTSAARETLGDAVETYTGDLNSVKVTTNTVNDTWTPAGLTLNQEKDTAVWVFTIKNDGENSIGVSVANDSNLLLSGTDITEKDIVKDTGYSVAVKYENDTTTESTKIAKTGETIKVTITLQILDYSKSITGADFDFTLNIQQQSA